MVHKTKIKTIFILPLIFVIAFLTSTKAAGQLSGYNITARVPYYPSLQSVNPYSAVQSYLGKQGAIVSGGPVTNVPNPQKDLNGFVSNYYLKVTKDNKTVLEESGQKAMNDMIQLADPNSSLVKNLSSNNFPDSNKISSGQTVPSASSEKCAHVKPGEDHDFGSNVFADREVGEFPEPHKDILGKVAKNSAYWESELNYKARTFKYEGSNEVGMGVLRKGNENNASIWPYYENLPHVGRVKESSNGEQESNYETYKREAEKAKASKVRWTSGGFDYALKPEQLEASMKNPLREYAPKNSEAVVQPGIFEMGGGVCDMNKSFWKVVEDGGSGCKFVKPTESELKNKDGSPTALGQEKAKCEDQPQKQQPPKKEDQKKKEEPKKNPPSASPSSSSKPFDDKINNPQNNPQGGNQNGGGQQPQGGGSPGGGQQPNQQNQYQSPYPSYYPYYSPTPYGYTPYPSYYPTPTPYSCPNGETAVCLKTGDSACASLDEIIVSSPTPSPSSSPSASPETSASPSASPSPTPTNGINADDISYFGPCVDWGSADKTDMMNQIASLITKAVGSDSGLFSSIDKIPESVLNAIVKAISGIIGQMISSS